MPIGKKRKAKKAAALKLRIDREDNKNRASRLKQQAKADQKPVKIKQPKAKKLSTPKGEASLGKRFSNTFTNAYNESKTKKKSFSKGGLIQHD